MTLCWTPLLMLILGLGSSPSPDSTDPAVVSISLNERGEAELAVIVAKLAEATEAKLAKPTASIKLGCTGVAGTLTRSLLVESLGRGVEVASDLKSLKITVPADRFLGDRKSDWETRLAGLAGRAEKESHRRNFYGMYARKSYVPNDPGRPTVLLVHGMNSTSSVFLHMVGPIEEAGYGVVAYDFPYNRDVDETAAIFERDWAEFRAKAGEKRPWVVLTHSMGAIPVRSYVEGPNYKNDVISLLMIAPVNGGAYMAKAQTALQFLQGVQAVNGKTRSDPLAHLGDGLGAAADDLLPGSPILKKLAVLPRRSGVKYRIIAGDKGLISEAARSQIVGRMGLLLRASGPSLAGQLEEMTDGRGDGCVALERTKLDGAAEHVVMHANHLELIRAPMLFPEPGPVVSMPLLLKWLETDAPTSAGGGSKK